MDPRDRLPLQLKPLADREWQATTIGKSGASVWRIPMAENALFLKADPSHELSELSAEVLRLDYLAEMGFPAPRIVDYVDGEGFNWLLMTEVKGKDLTHLVDEPQVLIQVLADGLKRLHALGPDSCPFDHSLDRRLSDGKANILGGRVDETDFDDRHEGWTAQQVYDWLVAQRPAETDRVVTHGDASLPNFLASDSRFSGIVDCARLGVADRWQDLALTCWSLEFNGGMDMVHAFLDAYGVRFDAELYHYYCALDELF